MTFAIVRQIAWCIVACCALMCARDAWKDHLDFEISRVKEAQWLRAENGEIIIPKSGR